MSDDGEGGVEMGQGRGYMYMYMYMYKRKSKYPCDRFRKAWMRRRDWVVTRLAVWEERRKGEVRSQDRKLNPISVNRSCSLVSATHYFAPYVCCSLARSVVGMAVVDGGGK